MSHDPFAPNRSGLIYLGTLLRLAVFLGLACGLAGCPKMKKRAEYNAMLWTAEANDNIERIFQLLANHFRQAKDKANYQFPSTGPTPAHIPCGRKPHAPDPRLWHTPGWKVLGFSIGSQFRFQYRVVSKGRGPGATFTIRAHADLDCDGVYSTYERVGTIDKRGNIKDGYLTWDKSKEIE